MSRTTSVATTSATRDDLVDHLVRLDGQEDLCLALYRPSTGHTRTTALLTEMVAPEGGDRQVQGNATVTGQYVLRAAALARDRGCGIALLHSHPGGRGWQGMSGPDRDAESAYANLAREITGLPLVGLTLAGTDGSWSARHWDRGAGRTVAATCCDNVRVIADRLEVSWNDRRVPIPPSDGRLVRTRFAWGDVHQADLARRRVLVVGAGSVGLDLVLRLAASGLTRITVMDFDIVKLHNLDRMIGASLLDVVLGRRKIDVARREALRAATAGDLTLATSDLSICEPAGLQLALDHDLILSAVDRPWPRAILNALAYTDLIPVIDGGIAIDVLSTGAMRNATWRSHVLRPGRPCMSCTRQLDGAAVASDIQGLLDNPEYIAGLPDDERERHERASSNVAPLAISASASILSQYVSYSVAPGGLGDPGPLQYVLSTHHLERVPSVATDSCPYEADVLAGDGRTELTGKHPAAEAARARQAGLPWRQRLARRADDAMHSASLVMSGLVEGRLPVDR